MGMVGLKIDVFKFTKGASKNNQHQEKNECYVELFRQTAKLSCEIFSRNISTFNFFKRAFRKWQSVDWLTEFESRTSKNRQVLVLKTPCHLRKVWKMCTVNCNSGSVHGQTRTLRLENRIAHSLNWQKWNEEKQTIPVYLNHHFTFSIALTQTRPVDIKATHFYLFEL